MKCAHLSLTILTSIALTGSASAQSFNNTALPGPNEARVQAGIVIPLGSGGTDAERAPRIEAWSDHRSQRPQASLRPDLDQPTTQPMRIGINFTGDTRLMVNGREALNQTGSKGISTLGWAGITVGVVAVAFGAALLGAFGDCLTPC
jgi:hypothetical protein